jgi:DNA-binding GntR family transcriptional regulator
MEQLLPTASARIYKELATQIIQGKLSPGQKLEEMQLAAQFGVSRTPIREALRELAARGFIDLVPRRGGVVTRVSLDQLIDMLEAECEVEALCASLSAHRMTALEKSALESTFAQMEHLVADKNVTQYLELNQTFHAQINAGAHNATISGITRDLREKLAPFRQQHMLATGIRLTQSLEEHREIVRAIMAGSAHSAYEAMRRHNARLSVGVVSMLRDRHVAGA